MGKKGLNFSLRIDTEPEESRLEFIKQLGVGHVYTWFQERPGDPEKLVRLKEKVERAGLTLYNAGAYDIAKSDQIHLNLAERDQKIEEFKGFIEDLGRAGITTTTFTWEPTGVWSSDRGQTRGASARRVDLEEMKQRPMTHGRRYTEDEIWDNYRHFIDQVLPVAEKHGVRLALHPNDPPAESLGGVPSLIHSFESYRKAFAYGDSPNLGMEFCTGCWLEGGDEFGDILEALEYFLARDKIFIIHFRNVSSTLPRFVETFLDTGYMDMYKLLQPLVEHGYEGTVTPDHVPRFAEGYQRGTGEAYAIGYMHALYQRAEAELEQLS